MDTVREMEEKLEVNANVSTDTTLLLRLDVSHSLMYLLSGERLETRTRLDFPGGTFQVLGRRNPFTFTIMDSSVNGILCLLHGHKKVVLWNPSTSEFMVLPPSLNEFEPPYREVYYVDYKGFGYDHVTNDYKVIRFMEFELSCNGPISANVSHEPLWEIYSLRSDSWKKLDCKMLTASLDLWSGVRLYTDLNMYNKGVCHCHWLDGSHLIDGSYHIDNHVSCLVSFDLSNEVFSTTPAPSYMGDGTFPLDPMRIQLGVINGCVALISNYPEKTTTIEVSILREIGVKESWTKLFIIGPLPCVWNLVGVGKNGHIFIQNENNDEIAWFEWSTHEIVYLGLKLPNCQIVTYKENFESLISLGFEKYD